MTVAVAAITALAAIGCGSERSAIANAARSEPSFADQVNAAVCPLEGRRIRLDARLRGAAKIAAHDERKALRLVVRVAKPYRHYYGDLLTAMGGIEAPADLAPDWNTYQSLVRELKREARRAQRAGAHGDLRPAVTWMAGRAYLGREARRLTRRLAIDGQCP